MKNYKGFTTLLWAGSSSWAREWYSAGYTWAIGLTSQHPSINIPTVKTGMIRSHTKTSRIPSIRLGGKNTVRKLSFSLTKTYKKKKMTDLTRKGNSNILVWGPIIPVSTVLNCARPWQPRIAVFDCALHVVCWGWRLPAITIAVLFPCWHYRPPMWALFSQIYLHYQDWHFPALKLALLLLYAYS